MGTHPIFESDFDCLTEQVKCPSPCWLPDFPLSQNWLPASLSAPCLFRSKTATLTRRQIHRCGCRHRWRRRIWSRNRNCVRLSHYWLRPQPVTEGAVVLLRHLGLCLVRGHGTLLPHGCLPYPLRSLSLENRSTNQKRKKKPRHVPIYLLAVQRCGGVGNVVVTPHQPTLCNNACTSLD